MKQLPLLSDDFKKFSWTSSIGDATATQLQNAYNALTNQGETKEFSYKVWNDLVELLYQAIIQSGHSWDSRYGSYANTRIMFKYDELTASRFNAMTWNITRLINLTWRWEVDTSVDGFIGRLQFVGVSDVGAKADFVYGWYLIELARVINLFIDILKNEANFVEFPCKSIIPMVDYCNVRSREAIRITANDIISTLHEVTVRNCTAVPIGIYDISKTIDLCVVYGQQGRPMDHRNIIKSLSYVNMASLTGRRMYHRNIINSISYSYLHSLKGVPIELEQDIIDSPNDCKVVTAQGVPMNHQNIMNVIDSVKVISAYPVYFMHEGLINTIDSVVVSNVYPQYLTHNGLIRTIDSVILSAQESAKLTAKEIVKTIDSMKLDTVEPVKVIANENIKTISYCKLETEWVSPDDRWAIQNGTNLYIKQAYSIEKNNEELFIDTEVWLEPIQEGKNLYIRQMYDELKGKEE